MNTIHKYVFCLLLLLGMHFQVAGQNHNIYVTAGRSFSLNYEGILFKSKEENGDRTMFGFKFNGGISTDFV